jgi:hypothetical protein
MGTLDNLPSKAFLSFPQANRQLSSKLLRGFGEVMKIGYCFIACDV